MRIIVMSCVALLSYLLQSTMFEYIQVYGIKPNLIIITIISFGLIRGAEEGAVYGFFSGLLLDVMSAKIIGIYSLLGMYLGLIVGKLNNNIYNENYINAILLTAGGTVLYNIFYYFMSISSNASLSFIDYFSVVFLPEIIYNCIMTVFVYYVVLYLNKKLDYNKKAKTFKMKSF